MSDVSSSEPTEKDLCSNTKDLCRDQKSPGFVQLSCMRWWQQGSGVSTSQLLISLPKSLVDSPRHAVRRLKISTLKILKFQFHTKRKTFFSSIHKISRLPQLRLKRGRDGVNWSTGHLSTHLGAGSGNLTTQERKISHSH